MPEGFYLRLRPTDQRAWVRRNTWSLGYSRAFRLEEATAFATREEAVGFARQFKIANETDLVTITTEALHAA